MVKKIIGVLFVFIIRNYSQTPAELLDKGKVYFEQGNMDSAEKVLLTAIEMNGTYAEAYFLLSQVYLTLNDLNKCREQLNFAIKNDEHNEFYRTEFEKVNEVAGMMANGIKNLESGDQETAIEIFESVIEKLPPFAAAPTYYIGVAKGREGDVRLAASYFQRALEINPQYERAKSALRNFTNRTFNEGNQYIRRGDYEGAMENYYLVLELDSLYYKAYFQLGVINTKLGDYSTAIENYKKAVNIEPKFAKGWFALGLGLQKNGDLKEAINAFKKAIEADQTYAKAYAQMGTIYVTQENLKLAENAYNMAIQVDPSYAKPYQDLGHIYVQQERYEEAINMLLTATALDKKSPKAWYFLAQAYNATSQCQEAKGAALGSLSARQNYAPAFFELGIAENCLGNKTAALQAFEKARKDRAWRKPAEYEIDKIKNPEKYKDIE